MQAPKCWVHWLHNLWGRDAATSVSKLPDGGHKGFPNSPPSFIFHHFSQVASCSPNWGAPTASYSLWPLSYCAAWNRAKNIQELASSPNTLSCSCPQIPLPRQTSKAGEGSRGGPRHIPPRPRRQWVPPQPTSRTWSSENTEWSMCLY